jgi:GPH family glycoside/pentoside/hexuronide:cation symporter
MVENPSLESEQTILDVKVPASKKALYGVGSFGTQMFNGIQANATTFFWIDIMALDNLIFSFIMAVIYNIWNAVNDPIFGWMSDRTKTRWGRRIPYIRFFSPIWMIGTIFLFFPYLNLDQIGMAIWFTVFILIFDGCYTLVAGCYNSLMPELSTRTEERTKINTISQIFAIIGIGLSFIFPLLTTNNLNNFFLFVIIASIISMLVLFIPSFFIKEKELPKGKGLGLIKATIQSIKNKPFMSFVGWNFMIQFTTSILLGNVLFYATYVLQGESITGILLFVALFIPLLPGFIIWPYISKRKGIRFTVMICTFIIACGLTVLFFSDFILSLISLAFSGFGLAGLLIFANVMIAEASDWDELRTKQRREAMFFGTNALFTKPAIGIASAVIAIILYLTGFQESGGSGIILPQPPTAILGIRMIMGLIPAIALFVSLIFIYFYPSKKETEQMKQKLSLLHQNS